MTSTLHEDLAALAGSVREVPARLADLARDAEQFEAATEAVLGVVAETARDAEEELGSRLAEVLGRVREAGQGGAEQLQSAAGETGEELERVVQGLEAGLLALQSATDEVRTRLAAVDEALEEGTQAVRAAAEELEAETGDAGQRLHDAREPLDAAADELQSALTATRERVADARAGAHEQVGELEARLADHRANVESALAGLDGEVARFADEMRGLGERLGAEIATQATAIGEQARAGLSGDAHAPVEQGASTLREGIEQMARSIVDGRGELADGSHALAPLFRELESALGPVRDALEELREAAAKVGHAF